MLKSILVSITLSTVFIGACRKDPGIDINRVRTTIKVFSVYGSYANNELIGLDSNHMETSRGEYTFLIDSIFIRPNKKVTGNIDLVIMRKGPIRESYFTYCPVLETSKGLAYKFAGQLGYSGYRGFSGVDLNNRSFDAVFFKETGVFSCYLENKIPNRIPARCASQFNRFYLYQN